MAPQRDDPVRPSAADLRVLLLQSARESLHFRVGAFSGDPGTQARDQLVGRRRALLERKRIDAGLHRDPDFSRVGHVERGREHTDDDMRRSVERQCASDRIAPSAEATLPEAVADQRHGRSARTILFGREKASQRRAHSQRREIARRYRRTFEMLGLVGPDQRELPLPREPGVLERARLLSNQGVVEKRSPERVRPLAQRHAEDEPVHVANGQRPEQECVHRAEDGGVRRDAECDGEHRDGRESGAGPQNAQAVAQVLPEVVHRPSASAFSPSRDVPERQTRKSLGLAAGERRTVAGARLRDGRSQKRADGQREVTVTAQVCCSDPTVTVIVVLP